MKATAKSPVPWSRVWKLYLDNQRVFWGVFSTLRRRGVAISDEEATDLIHEFLLERAPQAIATYNPDRGEIESWLFVVFRRFVMGTYRSNRRMESLLKMWGSEFHDFATAGVEKDYEIDQDLNAVKSALRDLTAQEKRAVTLFFENRRNSVRSVARELGLSRWKTARTIAQAGAKVALALGADIGVEMDDLLLLAGNKPHGVKPRSSPKARSFLKLVQAVVSRLADVEKYPTGDSQ